MKKELILVAVTIVLLIAAAIAACRQTAITERSFTEPGSPESSVTPSVTAETPRLVTPRLAPSPTSKESGPAIAASPYREELAPRLEPSPTMKDDGTPVPATPYGGDGLGTPTPGALPPTPPPLMSRQEWEAIAFRYVSEKYKVPISDLVTGQLFQVELPLTGFTLMQGKIEKLRGGVAAWLIVIDQNKKVYEPQGLATLQEAEKAAYRQKYGKMEARLFDVLQAKGPDDRVWVSIGVKGARQDSEVWAEMAARYPGRVDRFGNPGKDTPMDYYYRVIYADFLKEVAAEATKATGPLVGYLRGQGYYARPLSDGPHVTAFLPKRVILEIQKRDDVANMNYVSQSSNDGLNSSVPSIGAPSNWATGTDSSGRPITGEGVNIGMVETFTVEFDGHPYLRGTVVGLPLVGLHATKVAGAMASSHPLYRGPAYKGYILSAKKGDPDPEAYQQATRDVINAGARVVNLSWGEQDPNFRLEDMFYDDTVRQRRVTFVAITHNSASAHVASPGKGFNVITVGGSEDNNDAPWKGDVMWVNSSWWNAVDKNNEKPEVVAPAKDIITTTASFDDKDLNHNRILGDSPEEWGSVSSGTSVAAPQVSGGVAMLFQKNYALTSQPEAVKAILMASAVHNIDGPPDIYGGSDKKDGAGAVSVAEAYRVVNEGFFRSTVLTMPTQFPGGWYVDSWNVPVGTNQGLRAAIAWDSFVDLLSDPKVDELRTNLDLYVYLLNAQGQEVGDAVARSTSLTSSVELIDFMSTEPATYKIKIKRELTTPNTEDNNWLGVAWWVGNRYYAANSLKQEERPSDLVVLQRVGLESFSEPRVESRLGNEVAVPGDTLSYGAKATYPGWDPSYASYRHPSWPPGYEPDPPYSSRHPVWVKNIEPGDDPFLSFTEKSTHNDAYQAYTTFSYTANVSGAPLPLIPARMGATLNGHQAKPYDFYQYFESLAAPEAGPAENITPQTAAYWVFQRGDANADGVVTIVDANWVAQYLARQITFDRLNAVNAASPRHDDPPLGTADYDRINIQDAMFIAQMLAGLRDDFYEFLPSSLGSYSTKAGGQATVEAGALQLSPSGTGRIPIVLKNITGMAGVGSYDIKITYDPRVIKVTAVDGGMAPFEKVAAYKIDGAKGVVWLNAFHVQVPGLTKDGVIAYLNVSSLAAAGKSTNVQVTITTLSDVVGNDVSSQVVNGSVTIK